MQNVFFGGWDSVIRIVVTTPLIYLTIILYVRLFGKRSTSKMNAFDWIVTVAMGSIVASTVVLKDVTVVDGAAAIGGLLCLQWAFTKFTSMSSDVEDVVKTSPTLVLHHGEYLEEAMKRERVSRQEVRAAVREAGIACEEDVLAVVLETDASFSVIGQMRDTTGTFDDDDPDEEITRPTILKGVDGFRQARAS